MRLQFIGSGDAFGTGGRFNTCFHVTGESHNFLIDCGASSMVALRQNQIDLRAIGSIVFSHFHGDHFGGIPAFILDAQMVSRRETPLVLAGPPGIERWYDRVVETAFPGFPARDLRFPLHFHEIPVGGSVDLPGMRVSGFPMQHVPAAGPCLALRIEVAGKVLTYSGDTEWVSALIPAARNADVFICECYTRDKPVPVHMSYAQLEPNLPAIGAKRVILTHMSNDMLRHRESVACETAHDGMMVEF